MTELDFRRLMWNAPAVADFLRLSVFQHKVLAYIKDHNGVGAAQLAEHNESSVQSASAVLRLLHRKGYVDRYMELDPTGGIFYIYKFNLDGGANL